MKRVLLLSIVAAMILSSLTGCSMNQDQTSTASENTSISDGANSVSEESSTVSEESHTNSETSNASDSSENVEPTGGEDFESDDWRLLLVNSTHPLPDGYTVDLATIQGGYEADSRVASAFKEMEQAAQADGIDLLVCSAYRSHEKQTTNFENDVQTLINQGYSEEEARATTATYIAVPGTSEHETGLAVDIVTPSYQNLDDGYADTAAAKWLKENAYKYGFILRYPKDKEDITKIIFEPWHYRYVGVEYATQIMQNGLCLEEFLGEY